MRILIVCPIYAPAVAVGAQRMLSLTAYLAARGNEVHVLASEGRGQLNRGQGTTVPDKVMVHRYSESGKSRYLSREWSNAKAFKRALVQLLSLKTFDVLLVSCGPFYTLMPLRSICRRFKLPYVIDYRDLGVLDYGRIGAGVLARLKTACLKPLRVLYEKNAVAGAAYTVLVCEGDAIKLERVFKPRAVKVIYNGFDEARLEQFKPVEKSGDTCTIGYLGKLMYYDKTRGIALFKAVDQLRKQGINARIMHIGLLEQDIETLARKYHFDPQVYEGYGPMDYLAGMETLAQADFCAIEYVHPNGYGTKVFDYIYLNKPILALMPEKIALAQFLRRFPNAYLCQTQEQLVADITKLWERKVERLDDKLDKSLYSRGRQNGIFENILLETIAQGNAGKGQ